MLYLFPDSRELYQNDDLSMRHSPTVCIHKI